MKSANDKSQISQWRWVWVGIATAFAAAFASERACGAEDKGEKEIQIVLAIAEPEYETLRTLPVFAERMLHAPYGFGVTVVGEDPVDPRRLSDLPGALERADLLIVSIRRRALTGPEMAALKKYLAGGKPVVGIRTASHAFAPRDAVPDGFEKWEDFDPRVLGGHYTNHHPAGLVTTVTAGEGSKDDAILRGVTLPFESRASLYQVSPLRGGVRPLLVGRVPGQPAEPVAWTTMYGRSRVFYTSLGYKEDFGNPSFVTLLRNGVMWALGRE